MTKPRRPPACEVYFDLQNFFGLSRKSLHISFPAFRIMDVARWAAREAFANFPLPPSSEVDPSLPPFVKVRVYSGIHSPACNQQAFISMTRLMEEFRRKGAFVFTRELSYRFSGGRSGQSAATEEPAEGMEGRLVASEKGIDLKLGFDLFLRGTRRSYDYAVVASLDRDLETATDEMELFFSERGEQPPLVVSMGPEGSPVGGLLSDRRIEMPIKILEKLIDPRDFRGDFGQRHSFNQGTEDRGADHDLLDVTPAKKVIPPVRKKDLSGNFGKILENAFAGKDLSMFEEDHGPSRAMPSSGDERRVIASKTKAPKDSESLALGDGGYCVAGEQCPGGPTKLRLKRQTRAKDPSQIGLCCRCIARGVTRKSLGIPEASVQGRLR